MDHLCNSWFIRDLDAIFPGIRLRCTTTRVLPGIPGNPASYLRKSCILGNNSRRPRNVSHSGLCMEIVPPTLPPIWLSVLDGCTTPNNIIMYKKSRSSMWPTIAHGISLPSFVYGSCSNSTGWSNSKKRSAKYKECANNVGTHSLRETKVRCALSAHTTLLNIEASTVKWKPFPTTGNKIVGWEDISEIAHAYTYSHEGFTGHWCVLMRLVTLESVCLNGMAICELLRSRVAILRIMGLWVRLCLNWRRRDYICFSAVFISMELSAMDLKMLVIL